MGTGKTTISKALSKITGFQEIDVDEYIVKKSGRSISDIFEKEGEDYITKGDNNNIKDKEKVSKESIEGKVIHHSKFMNYLMKFSPIIIIILLIIVLIFC